MVRHRRAGFTLVEAIVALALSSVLVILVGTTFLVQNRYYAVQLQRSAAQDNARTATDMITSEIRSTMKGGVVTAGNKQLVIRSPIALAVVCAMSMSGHLVSVHIEGGKTGFDTLEVSGIAIRDTVTTGWTYYDSYTYGRDWAHFQEASGTPAASCQANGADTVGARNEFLEFRRLNTYFGFDPPLGSVLMVYRTVEYKFDTSGLDPTTLALFRGVSGGGLTEFATGMSSTAQFQYRTGSSTYATSVTGGALATIDAIRIEARALGKPQTGGVADVVFGWGVNVVLRNGG